MPAAGQHWCLQSRRQSRPSPMHSRDSPVAFSTWFLWHQYFPPNQPESWKTWVNLNLSLKCHIFGLKTTTFLTEKRRRNTNPFVIPVIPCTCSSCFTDDAKWTHFNADFLLKGDNQLKFSRRDHSCYLVPLEWARCPLGGKYYYHRGSFWSGQVGPRSVFWVGLLLGPVGKMG